MAFLDAVTLYQCFCTAQPGNPSPLMVGVTWRVFGGELEGFSAPHWGSCPTTGPVGSREVRFGCDASGV